VDDKEGERQDWTREEAIPKSKAKPIATHPKNPNPMRFALISFSCQSNANCVH